MRRLVIILILFSLASTGIGQEADSVQKLTLEAVFELALQYHPIIQQADLQNDFAEAELRAAKGQFDPKISSNWDLKNLKDTEYYNKLLNTLKVPTWFPLDPKVEVYRNTGTYLNPESFVSSSADYWQVTTGVSLPVGKGLFIDERRSIVKQARYFSDLAAADQTKLMNTTLLDITKSYWNWYLAYQKFQLMSRSLEIAEELFDRVLIDFEFGEAAVIDTVQAKITYQSRQIDFQKAELELINAKLGISIHLWAENDIPLELNENIIPDISNQRFIFPQEGAMGQLEAWTSENHPEVIKLQTKLNQLEIEERWNKESLKPEVNLSYSLIDAPFNVDGTASPEWQENYKFGVDFSFPIFLRKERGKLQKTQLYQESVGFELIQIKQQVIADLRSAYAQLTTNRSLTRSFEDMAANYQRLLDAELFNLQQGESDLFKLNIQQDKYIEAQIKFLEAQTKTELLKAYLPYAGGLPGLSYQSLYE